MDQPLSIGQAWSEAASFVRREKRLLAPLVLALMVVPTTLSQLLQPANPFAGRNGFEPWMAVTLAALLAGLGGQMAVARLAMGWTGSLGGAIMLALTRLPLVIAAFILFFLGISIVLIPILIIVALLGGGAGAAGAAALGNGLSLIAILAAIPLILLAPALAVDQRLRPWALVKASWRAGKGDYWRLLGFFLLFIIASLILTVAASGVIGSIATLALGKPEPMSLSRLMIALVGGIIQGMVGTIYAAMLGRMLVQPRPRSISGI